MERDRSLCGSEAMLNGRFRQASRQAQMAGMAQSGRLKLAESEMAVCGQHPSKAVSGFIRALDR
jgi:hypothetical protein